MSQAALVLRGGPKWPDKEKVRRYGFTRLYWEAEDSQVDQAFLDAMRAAKYADGSVLLKDGVGLFWAQNWHSSDNASDCAIRWSKDLERLASPSRGSGLKQCAVIANIEKSMVQNAQYIADWLQAWRSPTAANRPTRETAWAVEGHQGGWIGRNFAAVTAINSDKNLTVLHENFDWDMTPWAADAMRKDLDDWGIDRAKLGGFYHTALPWFDGVVYGFTVLP